MDYIKQLNSTRITVVFFFFILSSLIAAFNLESINAFVYGPNEKPYGKTYGEYAQMHWTIHVNLDPTQSSASESYQPQKCFFMEYDNKIFLQDFYAESKSNRDRSFDCTIPQKPIVIPVLTEGCSYGDYQNPADRNDNKLIECAHSHNPYAVVELTIDGQRVNNIDAYRTTSDFFTLNVTNPNNAYEIEVGKWRAIMDAIMIVVDLTPGMHTIDYKINQKNPEIIMPKDFLLKTNVKYNLLVEPDNDR